MLDASRPLKNYTRRDKELMDYSHILNKSKLDDLARVWLEEDCPSFDLQALIIGKTYVRASIKCKENALLAGYPFVDAILNRLNCKPPSWIYEEGVFLHDPTDDNAKIVANIVAPADEILLAERTILNVLARCSGVATAVHNVRTTLSWGGWTGQVVGSRKTTPGFRLVEKYGLLCGGGGTHRMDVSQMVMLKDNHIKAAGAGRLTELIQKVNFFVFRNNFLILLFFRQKVLLVFTPKSKLSAAITTKLFKLHKPAQI